MPADLTVSVTVSSPFFKIFVFQTPVLAVLVEYEANSESGEDLCDRYIKERHYVPVAELFDWLAERGFREPKKK